MALNLHAISQVETLSKIEKEHGPQWDFCTCVLKNDSINRAFTTPNLSDQEFDELFERADAILEKCMAFLALNAVSTEEEREQYKQKVLSCLREIESKSE